LSRQFDPKQFVQMAGDAIVAASADGAIVVWNPAAERIFGYTEREALGQSLDLLIPERFRLRHWDGYREVMRTGHTKYGTEVLRVPAVHKDGRTLSIAFTVTLMRAPDTRARVIAAIIREETTRWNEERELRRRLASWRQNGPETARHGVRYRVPCRAGGQDQLATLPSPARRHQPDRGVAAPLARRRHRHRGAGVARISSHVRPGTSATSRSRIHSHRGVDHLA
jgi:PAS domain S-box-containing protein